MWCGKPIWRRLAIATGLIVWSVAVAIGQGEILSDFEAEADGWRLKDAPASKHSLTRLRSRSGKHSLAVKHRFGPGSETLIIKKEFDPPLNYAAEEGFYGLSVWVYFSGGTDHWEAQIGVHSGDTWKWTTGRLFNRLDPGWHRIEIRAGEIDNPSDIRDIEIQLKNFIEKIDATVYIDKVEAMTRNGKDESR